MKSNTIAPGARTRLTLATPGLDDIMKPKEGVFDQWDPANISPFVVWLCTDAAANVNGRTFLVAGNVVGLGSGVDSQLLLLEFQLALFDLHFLLLHLHERVLSLLLGFLLRLLFSLLRLICLVRS